MNISERFSAINLNSVYQEKVKNKAGRGIDGISARQFSEQLPESLTRIESKVLNGAYRYTPYLEILKSKGRSKQPRVISKPSIKDKLTLSVLKDCIQEIFPESIDRKLPNTYIREIREFIETADSDGLSFCKLDICGFYDNIDRDILFAKLKAKITEDELLSLIRRAIINRTVPKN